MNKSPEQMRMATIASLYGYKNTSEDTVSASRFLPGDGVIVLSSKGEPIMSGTVEDVNEGSEYMSPGLKVNGEWYYDGRDKFRVL